MAADASRMDYYTADPDWTEDPPEVCFWCGNPHLVSEAAYCCRSAELDLLQAVMPEAFLTDADLLEEHLDTHDQ